MFNSMRGITKFCNYICGAITLVFVVFLFLPFWEIGNKTQSICQFIWINASDKEVLRYFRMQLAGQDANVNLMAACCAGMLLPSIAGVFLSFTKPDKGKLTVVPVIGAVVGIVTYLTNSVYMLGTTVTVQLVLCALIIVAAIVTFIFDIKKVKQEAIGGKSTPADIAAKVATIRSLTTEVTAKKGSIAIAETNFNKLLAYLKDDDAECRLAAAEMLGGTSKEVAFTHIVYLLKIEKDEAVKEAMKNALISIKANIGA